MTRRFDKNSKYSLEPHENDKGGGDRNIGRDGEALLDHGIGNDRLNGDHGQEHHVVEHNGVGRIPAATKIVDHDVQFSVETRHSEDEKRAEVLIGNASDNVLTGTDGNDIVFGGGGNDTVNGGAGNDLVSGGRGDDILIYNASENIGVRDFYLGGPGTDTLRLELTPAEAAAAAADIEAFEALLRANSESRSSQGRTFHFTAFDLTVRGIERLEVVIAGGNTPPVVAANTATTFEDNSAFSFDLLTGASDGDGPAALAIQSLSTSVSGSQGRVLTLGTHYSLSDSTITLTAAGLLLLDSLADGQKEVFVFDYEVSDGKDATPNTLTLTITGQNDSAIISGVATGSVIEDAALSTVSGDLNATDVDNTVDTFQSVSSPVASENDYGTYTVTAAGVWTYALDNANPAVNALAEGETLADRFPVLTEDGTPQVVKITVTGANDAPAVSGVATAKLSEVADQSESEIALTASGMLSFADADLSDTGHTSTISGVHATGTAAGLPDESVLLSFLTLGVPTKPVGSSAGKVDWSFAAADRIFDYLGQGSSVTLTYSVIIDDGKGGSGQGDIAIVVTGSNDTPIITAAVDEGTVDAAGVTTAVGTIEFADLDSSDSHITTVMPAAAGYLGSLTVNLTDVTAVNRTGTIAWSFIADATELDAFAAGETRQQTYTVAVADGFGGTATRTITVTLNGPAGELLAPTVTGVSDDTGVLGDGVTSDSTLLVHGTSTPSAAVEVLLDGNSIGTTTADDAGAWTYDYTSVSLSDGAHIFTAKTISGSQASTPSNPLGIEIDSAPPALSSVSLAPSSDTGPIGDLTTAMGSITLIGQSDAGSVVQLVGTPQSTIVANDGTFSLGGIKLATGTNPLTLRAVDVAGNATELTLVVERDAVELHDPVLEWNQIALDAIRADASTPTFASRGLAMQSIAIFDALNAIDGTPAYMVGLPAPAGADAFAAVVSAAHAVLSYLYPAQAAKFDARLASDLATIADGAAKTGGVALGQAIADAIIELRSTDGWDFFVNEPGGTGVGEWRPTGPMFEPAASPQWATLETFALQTASQFRPVAPPSLDSAEYAAAVNELYLLGGATSAVRTADQTEIARFWQDGLGTYTPAGHWNEIATSLLSSADGGWASNARALASLNIALADAGIAAWDAKYTYDLWRPITAISNADLDGNAATIADPTWSPFLITPNHPDYVSGHSTYSGAAAEVLTGLLGSVSFTTTSFDLPGVERSYESFLNAAAEAGRSRIYGGIHYEFSNQAGQETGFQIGDWVLDSFRSDVDVRAPVILVTSKYGQVTAGQFTLTGFALDNLAGLSALSVALDGAAAFIVSVDNTGRFQVPVELPSDGTGDGSHSLVFTAHDAAGNQAIPLVYDFIVDTRAPTISISSLADGASLTATSRLTGSVDGTGSAVVSLSYSVAGGADHPIVFDISTGAFDTALDLKTAKLGSLPITVKATDAAGLVAETTIATSLDVAIPFAIESLTPANGAGEIGVTFRPQVTFTRAVDAATLTADSFYVTDASGAKLAANVVVSGDGLHAWMLLNEAMPGSSKVKLHLDGSIIKAAQDGALLDGDGDGLAGGNSLSSFSTVSRTALPNTTITGVVVGPGPDLKPMTKDDILSGPDGIAHTADDVFLEPIANAKVFILGFEDQAVFTDAQGRFTLTSVPGGDVKVAVDGRTASNVPDGVFYPEMVLDVQIRPGEVNTLMGTMGALQDQLANIDRQEVYLPRLDQAMLINIDATGTTTVTMNAASAPDLTAEERALAQLVIEGGSIIGEDGQVITNAQVGISTVPPELVRDMLPAGLLEHTFDITIQAPAAAVFTIPAQLTLPNTFDAAPGTKLNFLSFDHTTGRLVIEGTATVSEDGLSVTTDPGTGITKPGWHGLTPPGTVFDATKAMSTREKVYFRLGQLEKELGGFISSKDKYKIVLEVLQQEARDNSPLNDPDFVKPIIDYSKEIKEDPGFYRIRIKNAVGGVRGAGEEEIPNTDDAIVFSGLSWQRSNNAFAPQVSYSFATLSDPGQSTPFVSEFDDIMKNAARNALSDWSKSTGIEFFELSDGPNVQIRFGYEDIDGVGGRYAQTTISGDSSGNLTQVRIGFDISEVVQIVSAEPELTNGTKVASILLHEIGHAIGLDDTARNDSIMNPLIVVDGLQLLDKFAGASLYLDGIEPAATGFYYRVQAFIVPGDPLAQDIISVQDVRGFAQSIDELKIFTGSDFLISIYDPNGEIIWTENNLGITAQLLLSQQGELVNYGAPGDSIIKFSSNFDADTDGDGLSDDAEEIIGTKIDSADTDGDGVSDYAEIKAGSNPLDGLPVATGVMAAAALQGQVRAIAAENDIGGTGSTAFVATDTYGLAVVDIMSPFKPVVEAELDLPGTAVDVAIDVSLGIAAVAASTGLHLIDVTNTTAPRLLTTVDIAATQVEIIDGVAYVNSGGNLKSVDLTTGEEIATLDLSGTATTIAGLTHEGSVVYALDGSNVLHAIEVVDGVLMFEQGSLNLSQVGVSLSGDRKLFVADGMLYVPASNGFSAGYATIEVSDPAGLSLISGIDDNAIAGTDIALNGSGLGISVGSVGGVAGVNAIDIVRTDDPTNTGDFVTRITLPTAPTSVAIGNGLAFVGAGDQLQVVNYLAFDTAGQPPVVTVTNPPADVDPATPGIQVQEGQIVPFGVRITDDVQVRDVELLVNSTVQRVDGAYPFDLRAALPTIVANGGATTVTLQVRATDTGGNVGLSELVTIELVPDIVPPELVDTNVVDGATVGGSFRTLRFSFSEPLDPETVTASTFRLIGPDGLAITPTAIQVKNGGYSVQVTYAPLALGHHTVELDASAITDRAGNALGATVISQAFDVAEFSIEWIAATGGNAGDAANWSDNRVPGIDDDAFIGLAVGELITFDTADYSMASLTTVGPNLAIDSGSLTISSTFDVDGSVSLSGGRLGLDGAGKVGEFTQSSSTLTGAGVLTVTGSATFMGSSIQQSGSGTTDLQGGVTF
ncbi:MAG: VCBS domain-containing protein, partial [Hyphomicrobiaceae bacterium]|nr:VCBS domain-containing protein [Hyphomicrobiaceae bacterium]